MEFGKVFGEGEGFAVVLLEVEPVGVEVGGDFAGDLGGFAADVLFDAVANGVAEGLLDDGGLQLAFDFAEGTGEALGQVGDDEGAAEDFADEGQGSGAEATEDSAAKLGEDAFGHASGDAAGDLGDRNTGNAACCQAVGADVFAAFGGEAGDDVGGAGFGGGVGALVEAVEEGLGILAADKGLQAAHAVGGGLNGGEFDFIGELLADVVGEFLQGGLEGGVVEGGGGDAIAQFLCFAGAPTAGEFVEEFGVALEGGDGLASGVVNLAVEVEELPLAIDLGLEIKVGFVVEEALDGAGEFGAQFGFADGLALLWGDAAALTGLWAGEDGGVGEAGLEPET